MLRLPSIIPGVKSTGFESQNACGLNKPWLMIGVRFTLLMTWVNLYSLIAIPIWPADHREGPWDCDNKGIHVNFDLFHCIYHKKFQILNMVDPPLLKLCTLCKKFPLMPHILYLVLTLAILKSPKFSVKGHGKELDLHYGTIKGAYIISTVTITASFLRPSTSPQKRQKKSPRRLLCGQRTLFVSWMAVFMV